MGDVIRKPDNIIPLLLGAFCCAALPAQAEVPRAALMKLGQQFADTIGGRLQEADLYLSGAGKVTLAEHKAGTQISDGEPLIFQARAGKYAVPLRQDIYTVKRGGKLLISLGDFCAAADFAITVNNEKGTADGWFTREDQTFHLDADHREARIAGRTFAVAPDDIDTEGGNLLVSTDALEKWFGLSFDYDFSALSLSVAAATPLPAESAWLRKQKHGTRGYAEDTAKLPEQAVPYAAFSAPYFDTMINSTLVHSPGYPTTTSTSWSTLASNDAGGFSMQTFASGDDQKPYLNNLRIALGKEDEAGNLLGPLHATSYSFGDINTLSLPLIGGGNIEQGVAVSNRPADNITSRTETQVTGNAQPGWDVELYRNDVFIDIAHVDTQGIYNFPTVDLIVGDNDMKLLFHGPRGEVREEHRHVAVNPALLAGSSGYYAASLSRNNVTMWQRDPADTPGRGALDAAFAYEYGLGALGTVNAGVRRDNTGGAARDFSQLGLASYFYGAYLNADLGVDMQSLAATDSLTLRRNFGRQSALLQYTWNDRDYNITSTTGTASTKEAYRASLSGPLQGRIGPLDNLNYSLSTGLTNNYGGTQEFTLGPALSTRFGSLALTGSADYSRLTQADGSVDERMQAGLLGHGFAYGGTWRLESRYETLPTLRLTDADFSYDRAISDTLDTTTTVRYTPDPDYVDGSVSLNWRTQRATISPTAAIDTEKNLRLGVNVHFGSAMNPYDKQYGLTNSYVNNTGGVAARIFVDKNGNGIYDTGDEPAAGAMLRAPQNYRTAIADARGIAFLPDLPENALTDIVVEAGSTENPYALSLFDGVSIRPHPGSMTQLDFPLVTGGELDGQADYVLTGGMRKPAGGAKISLIAPDGKVEKSTTAAYDGYYSISNVRPGIYYLTAETAPDAQAGSFLPRLLEFRADGSTWFGQGVALTPDDATAYVFQSENPAPNAARKTRVVKREDIAGQTLRLRLGQYHSRLALTLAWYRFKLRSPFGDRFALLMPVSSIEPDPKTQLMDIDLVPLKPMTARAAADVCRKLQDSSFDCAVKIMTTYREPNVASAAR